MLYLLARILNVLNAENDPSQVSLAFSLSMIAGLTPLMSLHNLVVVFLVLFLRVNLSAFFVGLAMFSAIAYLFDPLFHILGLAILSAEPLKGLWTWMYNVPVFRIARFNNTIVMGSLVVSLVLFVPVFFLSKAGILRYRARFLDWMTRTRLAQAIKASTFYKVYTSLPFKG
ncbi:MAG: TIGR03546 family protein [Desulfomonilia bacterium]